MISRAKPPVDPSISPLAQAILVLEGTDPDACALLFPVDVHLTPEQLEVRARRTYPERHPTERAKIVAQAVEIQQLALEEVAAQKASIARTASPALTAADRAQRLTVLIDALEERPGMSAHEGREVVNSRGEIAVPEGTFHDGYWKPAIEGMSSHARRIREEMTACRPGKGKLNLSTDERSEVRQLVAVLKRDHPEWHRGRMMDEVRRVTPFQFRDPAAFGRNYVEPVDPAPPDARVPTSFLQSRAELGREQGIVFSAVSAGREGPVPVHVARTANEPEGGFGSLLHDLLIATDPLLPAELRLVDEGRVQVCLNIRPVDFGQSYQLVGRIYTEKAKLLSGITR